MPYIKIAPDSSVTVGFLAQGKTIEDVVTAIVGDEFYVLYSDSFIMKITEDIPNIVMVYDDSVNAVLDYPKNSLASDLICRAYSDNRTRKVFGDALLFKMGSRKGGGTGLVELSDEEIAILNVLLGE